jgi:hypothetical protein
MKVRQRISSTGGFGFQRCADFIRPVYIFTVTLDAASAISGLLGVWLIYLATRKDVTFHWSGHMGRSPRGQKDPGIPRWIGVPLFLCVGVWLLFYSIRHMAR